MVRQPPRHADTGWSGHVHEYGLRLSANDYDYGVDDAMRRPKRQHAFCLVSCSCRSSFLITADFLVGAVNMIILLASVVMISVLR